MNGVQDAFNYLFYMDRLKNPGLLDHAVVTEDNDLAVPVGGTRIGGYVSADTRAAGKRLVRQLAARPADFPDARLVLVDGWCVEWGPYLDWRGCGCGCGHPEDYVAAGRYFGYTEAAIAEYAQMVALRSVQDSTEEKR